MSKRPEDDDRNGEETDFLDITVRVAGWLAMGTGVGMLIFFFLWLRGQ